MLSVIHFPHLPSHECFNSIFLAFAFSLVQRFGDKTGKQYWRELTRRTLQRLVRYFGQGANNNNSNRQATEQWRVGSVHVANYSTPDWIIAPDNHKVMVLNIPGGEIQLITSASAS